MEEINILTTKSTYAKILAQPILLIKEIKILLKITYSYLVFRK